MIGNLLDRGRDPTGVSGGQSRRGLEGFIDDGMVVALSIVIAVSHQL